MNAQHIRAHEALLNITWQGQNGDLSDPVPFDASDAELKQWATESIRGGSVRGIRTPDGGHRRIDLWDFVVDRFPRSNTTPYNRIFLRPKTPFG